MTLTPDIITYDLTGLTRLDLADPAARRRYWDETHLVAALQGLANREAPRLYLRALAEPDDFWWETMHAPGGWLEKSHSRRIGGLEALLAAFTDAYEGAVVWDERVPATSNLASTIAGAERLLPLRFDETPGSLYRELVIERKLLTVRRRLMAEDGAPLFTGTGTIPGTALPSTGSAKCDAYRWLLAHYVETGLVDPHRQGFYLDAWWLRSWFVSDPSNCTLLNHDYIIAHGGLFWDLNVWEDEAPVDDPAQRPGSDLETLKALLAACHARKDPGRMIHVCGFTPWAYKYTDVKTGNYSAGGGHRAVPTEWRTTEILTCFDAYLDADALSHSAMANASFFRHCPLPERVEQKAPRPSRELLIARGILDAQGHIVPRNYYAHYVGDYDAAAWLYWQLPRMWSDPARGTLPLTWAFNPNLEERFPVGMHWARRHATEADTFVTGDSGAGYINPWHLSEPREFSGLPDGWALWEKHSRPFFERWDLDVVGFVLDGHTPNMGQEGWETYARLAPGGLMLQRAEGPPHGVRAGIPYIAMTGDLPHDPDKAARMIATRLRPNGPHFMLFRSILRTPSWYAAVTRKLEKRRADGALPEAMAVDMPTLLWLIAEYERDRDAHHVNGHWAKAPAIVCRPGNGDGLYTALVSDGPFEEIRHPDGLVWQLPAVEANTYFYFDADEDFVQAAGPQVSIEILYLDAGTGLLQLHYDSLDPAATLQGAYKAAGEALPRTGTGEWRRARFVVPDARFQNRQNGLTDFRIWSHGDALVIREVVVSRQ